MNIFRCYECSANFDGTKKLIDHLKKVHKIKEKVMQIKCGKKLHTHICSRTFLTYDGLRKHLNKCYSDNEKTDEMVTKKVKQYIYDFNLFYITINRILIKIRPIVLWKFLMMWIFYVKI